MTDDAPARPRRRTVLLAAGSAGIAALTSACSGSAGTSGGSGSARRPAAPAAASATVPGAAAPQCVLTPEAGTGPYYVDLDRARSDVVEDREGVPLRLDLTVVRVSAGCRPLAGVPIDLWQADASGSYSLGGDTFLRGTQITDRAGKVTFRTIVPGWYAGLAPHIHFKVRPETRTETASQLYFPEDLLRQVYAGAPYAGRTAPKNPNGRDSRYRDFGPTMTLKPVPDGDSGYQAEYVIGIA
ncbi:dioxygenase family protein [Streptomyces antimicrobicus]|uniref:Intradiol ring-cleavage dioxygenase n=1 Tax=Streptomyces antimicrobicus TaxID=2883108 RepID=A0ABS8B8K2_9ACTN|nr:intradiol ring-cleavage dioxygenase [Streptomyces antimicrobicus]MCB5180934.1 intradiol ring-cleavage dioxygenase [Streptomyces antimicrobicus]